MENGWRMGDKTDRDRWRLVRKKGQERQVDRETETG